MTEARFDPQVWARQRTAHLAPTMAWTPGPLPAMRGWQRRLRTRLRQIAGIPRQPPGEVKAETIESIDFGDYRRETVHFETQDALDAFGYFLTPANAQPRGPVVLCLPGHGRGVDSIVGIREDGSQRGLGEPGEYAADFALQCVAQGYSAFALEQISFGRRRDALAASKGESSSCQRDSMAALMLGETMTGWRVWDAMRALDYLEGRPEVDRRRMAVMGISGGGLTALWTACLDTRVRAAVVSGYFNMYQASVLAMPHCVDNYVPGLSETVEMPDLAGLVAPRLLFVENGRHDPIFPVSAFSKAADHADRIYAAFDAADHFGATVFEGGHEYHGVEGFRFLKAHL